MEKFTDAEIAFILEAKEKKQLGWETIASNFNKKFGKAKTYSSVETCYRRYKNIVKLDRFSDNEIAYIVDLKDNKGHDWDAISTKYNKKFVKDKSADDVKNAYFRFKGQNENDANHYLNALKTNLRQTKANRLNSKENRYLVEMWEGREDILDAVKGACKIVTKVKKLPKSPTMSKGKAPMTLELLISDVHVGKKTDTFDHTVLKRRLKQVAEVTLKEIERAKVHYNIERIIIAFLGDVCESYSMHGLESAKGCEFGNSKQVEQAIAQLYSLVLEPIASTGIQIDAVGVPGNHDRTEHERTFNKPGEENLTWIIYNAMKMLTEARGFANVNWHISREPWMSLSIYGENVLYEHYDNVKGSNKIQGIETLMGKRTVQLGMPIHFIRGGHFHEPMESGIGKIVINGSVPGDDGYSETLGFRCEPSQTLNFYIKRRKDDSVKRITSFFKRHLIQLD